MVQPYDEQYSIAAPNKRKTIIASGSRWHADEDFLNCTCSGCQHAMTARRLTACDDGGGRQGTNKPPPDSYESGGGLMDGAQT